MPKCISLIFLLISLSNCKINKSVASTVSDISFIDAQTNTFVKPFSINDSLTKTKNNWKLFFSDEFNDNQIDTTKWTIENNTKKRPDVTLYSNNQQVEEKEGNAFIYYRKSSLHDSAYFAGRFNSKNKFATTYGFLYICFLQA